MAGQAADTPAVTEADVLRPSWARVGAHRRPSPHSLAQAY